MPINNIQFRAEIGLFYSTLHAVWISASKSNLLNSLVNADYKFITLPSLSNLLTFSVTFLLFPFISLIALSLGQVDLCKVFWQLYVTTYFCIRVFRNLFSFAAASKRFLAKLSAQYFFFFQVCIFLPHLKLFLLSCGDIEANPGPTTGENLTICHWNLSGICAQKNLPFFKRDDLTYLTECLVWEIRVKKSKCFFTCVYRSPSQNRDDMEMFLTGFEQICSDIALESPACSLVIGDFNAKCTSWWYDGENNPCGLELQLLSNILGYTQLIKEPTHFQPNKLPSCIDLIFVSQPNLVVKSGVHPSLYKSCHHQIIYAEISFEVVLPPSYEREVWHYNRANSHLINRSIEMYNWEKAFSNIGIDDQVKLLNEILLNIFRNFIPHEIIKCSYKDPPWMNKAIKSALRKKNRVYRKYVSSGRLRDHELKLKQVTDEVSMLISDTKSAYFAKLGEKLNDPNTGQKSYWSILKRLLNKTKIPSIPPILVDGVFETDFKKKAGLFNVFFSDQCNIFDNGSTLPEVSFKTDKRISSFDCTSNEILKIVNDLNSNKAHGHDGISIKMIKICSSSIVRPLKLIFDSAISCGHYPDSWKKGNIVPVHKKESKNLLKNYRPISLLPVFGKIFEKVMYNSLFKYFQQHNLLSENQSGFRSGDSCISQLLAITHGIYKCFDGDPSIETRGVFLDMSKAFDKVWHEGLLFKLKCYGVEGNFLKLLENYLHNRKQRVVLCGQTSSWLDVNAGVPQGSVLGPLLFLIYINDLPDNLVTIPKLFADDTSLFSTILNVNESSTNLNHDLNIIKEWAFQWKMVFNPDPNKQATEVVFSHKKHAINHPPLFFNGTAVASSVVHKHLGLFLDKKLTFDHHLSTKISKANKGISILKRLQMHLPRKTLLCVYKSYVRPHLDYADIIYDQPHNDSFCDRIESIQYNASLAITGAIRGTSRERLYQELGLESLGKRRWYHRLVWFYKIVHGYCPRYLSSLLPPKQFSHDRHRASLYRAFRTNTDYFKNSFFPFCVNEWNKEIGQEIKNSPSIAKFKDSLIDYIRPKSRSVYSVHDPYGLKLLTRLRLNFSHLREHKFRHNFHNPLCSCGNEIESTSHYLLRCPFYGLARRTLHNDVEQAIGSIKNFSDKQLVDLFFLAVRNLAQSKIRLCLNVPLRS